MKILDKNRKMVESIDLGRVLIGSSKVFEYYLFNDDVPIIEDINVKLIYDRDKLPPGSAYSEIKILECPTKLSKGETGKLRIKWSPSFEVNETLNPKIYIEYGEIWKL